MGRYNSETLGLEPLVRTKELAQRHKTRMYIHVVESNNPYEEILPYFDKGDILSHCFQSKGPYSILDEKGKIRKTVWEAKARGVVFDFGFGRTLHNYLIIKEAIAEGLIPDTISTDLTAQAIYVDKPYSLLYVIASFLAAGMPFLDVFRAVTVTPARLMKMEQEIGTLMPGAWADVAIFRLVEKPITFRDVFGNEIRGSSLLIPQMTIKSGRVVFRQTDFYAFNK
jgi:predicted amidohydrolase